ncbi:hypothetical protein [Streptomyces hygroscopicus]|nr:hypothetical protein [Streptomyces hygroscopicus]
MRAQISGLCLLLSLLFAVVVLAPFHVNAVTPQPAATVTAP